MNHAREPARVPERRAEVVREGGRTRVLRVRPTLSLSLDVPTAQFYCGTAVCGCRDPPPKSYLIEATNRRGRMGRARNTGPVATSLGLPSSSPLPWNAFTRSTLIVVPSLRA